MIEYREPFFGAGAIGKAVLNRLPDACRAWINDIDYGIYSMWVATKEHLPEMLDRIDDFIPSVDLYMQFKYEDGRSLGIVETGFRKLALHQMSFSGLGKMSGGPLGGKDQNNPLYRVDCRWNAATQKRKAIEWHQLLKRLDVKITNLDFESLLQTDSREVFIYLDPPYYVQGANLYEHAMSDDDHRRLASRLRAFKQTRWLLSYDDHQFIRQLYAWANSDAVNLTYTVANLRRKNSEILISP